MAGKNTSVFGVLRDSRQLDKVVEDLKAIRISW